MLDEFKKKFIRNAKGLLISGVSEKKYKDGTRYIGNYRPDSHIKEGKGILHCGNGDIYMGDLVNNSFEGEGVYFFSSGAIF